MPVYIYIIYIYITLVVFFQTVHAHSNAVITAMMLK